MCERINAVNVKVIPAGIYNSRYKEQKEDELNGEYSALYLTGGKMNHAEEVYYSADFNEQHYPVRIVD